MNKILNLNTSLFLTLSIFIITILLVPQTTNAQTVSCLKLAENLFVGSTGSSVTALQNFLKSKGHFTQEATGYYGAITQKSVELFQKAEGIVLNGTPDTTGFGRVGPTTRAYIEKMTCGSGASTSANDPWSSFFGKNLDDYFKDAELQTNIAFDTKINFDTTSGYKPADIDLDSDIDFDDDIDFEIPEITFNSVNYNSGLDNVGVYLFAKAVNGEFVRGGNTGVVAVASSSVDLAWEGDEIKDCVLSGDFKEGRLSVPIAGSAKLTMTRASARASNGDPLYQFRVGCSASTTKSYSLPTSDLIKLWIYHE